VFGRAKEIINFNKIDNVKLIMDENNFD